MQASRMMITVAAILILLAALAFEVDRQSRVAGRDASRQVAGAPAR